MATVYRALDPNSNREVAIKLLPHEMMHNVDFRKRFNQELKTISSLEHGSIVPVYDSGEEDGQPYFVMRYMTGGSLKEWLKSGPLSLKDTAVIVERLALGLAYAHKLGVIHRDIKPDNVLFDSNDNPYLTDFGVAKLAASTTFSTGSGIVGTPSYISPEQARGENQGIDHRSDIYGLGVLTYQMLTGEPPFKADTPMGVLVKHIQEPVPNIRDMNPSLPPSLDTIIKTALAKNKEDRYPSALEFARALSVAAFGEERTLPAALVLERKQAAVLVRNRSGWMIVGVVLLAILAGGYFSFPFIAPSATVSPTPSLTPSDTPTLTFTPSNTPTMTVTLTLQIPVTAPTAPGGADRVALLRGNEIVQMNLDGSAPQPLNSENYEKSNLQWITGGQFDGRLIYISPTHNCAYMVDSTSKEIVCFRKDEQLEGFRVSPDGTHVAISVAKTLYIVPFKYPFKEASWKDAAITRHILSGKENACWYSPSIKDVRWSRDGRRIAALVVDTTLAGSEQIHLFNVDLTDCRSKSPVSLVPIDTFPNKIFPAGLGRPYKIPSYDWDGDHLFLLNDASRNVRFGNLYVYDSDRREGKKVEPIGSCCYADARWSPDGQYVLFLYQDEPEGEIQLYYIPASGLAATETWTPIDTFKLRERAYPALDPSQ